MVAAAKINSSINSVRSAIAYALGYSHSGRRDLYDAFGYDRVVSTVELVAMYYRNDIANRIVRAFPQATWRDTPLVRDERGDGLEIDKPGFSPFALAVDEFFTKHKVMRYLERADRTSSLGKYGLLVLGFDDPDEISKPLPPGKHKLIYMSPYMESSITINQWETNPKSPRYGRPLTYTVQNREPDLTTSGSNLGPNKSFTVHYTRVIHVSEFLEQDDVFGTPRLLPIYNRLKDLEKVVGGSAETFWITANRGLALWADKDADLSPEEITLMQDQADEFQHQLRRYLVGRGMKAEVLGSEDPDPKPNFEALMQLISGACGIPMRILLGSERGELSSAQDENNWSERINERRENFATPSLLQPFISIMIRTGNLPMPEGKWWVEWPSDSLGPEASATVANIKSQALATYANSPVASLVVPIEEFRKDILGLAPMSEYAIQDLEEPLPEDDMPPSDTDEGDDGQDEGGRDEGSPDESEGSEDTKTASKDPPNVKPIYVYREVKNRAAILKWARENKLKGIADDLHVTLAYSKEPVIWDRVISAEASSADGGFIIPADHTRWLEMLGDDSSALALCFKNLTLMDRHQELKFLGTSHSYPSYKPHITLSTKSGKKLNLSRMKPFTGAIVLGPEKYKEI